MGWVVHTRTTLYLIQFICTGKCGCIREVIVDKPDDLSVQFDWPMWKCILPISMNICHSTYRDILCNLPGQLCHIVSAVARLVDVFSGTWLVLGLQDAVTLSRHHVE